MDNTVDILKLKIERARALLPAETVEAINAVPWQASILAMRETKGYSFEQLGDLEIETELLLCGLVTPENYPKELETRMRISKSAANDLVNEMNNLVFKKIREELVKRTEQKKVETAQAPQVTDDKVSRDILSSAGIQILSDGVAPSPVKIIEEKKETLPIPEKLEVETTKELKPDTDDVGVAKSAPRVEVPHPIVAEKLSAPTQTPIAQTAKPAIDPYREIPE